MRGVLVAAILTAACAPAVDGPVEKQAALDRADSARLTAQLAALPGVVRAEVILHRPARDPLAVAPAAPPTSSIVLVVDDKTDKSRTETSALSLSRALAPDIEPTLVVEVGTTRTDLAKLGPFTVAASSKPALKGALAIALAVIALLAGWIAWTYRSRLRA